MASTTTGLSDTLATEYMEKDFLERAQLMLVHDAGAREYNIPQGEGKTIKFNRYSPLSSAPSDSQITDEVSANEVNMTDTAITDTVELYGNYTKVSEFFDLTSIDGIQGLAEHVATHAQNLGETLDTIIRDELDGGGTTTFANAKAAATDVASSDTLDGADIRKAVADLKLAKAPTFMSGQFSGLYRAICPTGVMHDLRGDNEWLDAHRYVDPTNIKNGQFGILHGVEFYETNSEVIGTDAGSGTTDLYTTFFVGRESYATTSLGSNRGIVTIKRPSDNSTDNPLSLFMTVGWKLYYTAKVLNSSWVREMKSASSIGSN